MTKRQAAIVQARVAGYHNDARLYTRLCIESGVSRKVLDDCWAAGARAKKAGVPCYCTSCEAEVARA